MINNFRLKRRTRRRPMLSIVGQDVGQTRGAKTVFSFTLRWSGISRQTAAWVAHFRVRAQFEDVFFLVFTQSRMIWPDHRLASPTTLHLHQMSRAVLLGCYGRSQRVFSSAGSSLVIAQSPQNTVTVVTTLLWRQCPPPKKKLNTE